MKKATLLFNLGVTGLMAVILFIAGITIYQYVDGTMIYIEIKDGIIPKEPYDKIDHIELFGQALDGWYIANIFVSDTKTNDFANSMIRYNRDTKEFVIPSEQFGFESCIVIRI